MSYFHFVRIFVVFMGPRNKRKLKKNRHRISTISIITTGGQTGELTRLHPDVYTNFPNKLVLLSNEIKLAYVVLQLK